MQIEAFPSEPMMKEVKPRTFPPHTTVPPCSLAFSTAARYCSTACLVCSGPYIVVAAGQQDRRHYTGGRPRSNGSFFEFQWTYHPMDLRCALACRPWRFSPPLCHGRSRAESTKSRNAFTKCNVIRECAQLGFLQERFLRHKDLLLHIQLHREITLYRVHAEQVQPPSWAPSTLHRSPFSLTSLLVVVQRCPAVPTDANTAEGTTRLRSASSNTGNKTDAPKLLLFMFYVES